MVVGQKTDRLGVGANTGLLGVFGHPVRHTLSPCMHNAAFRFHALDLVYLAFDVPPDSLVSAIGGVRALGMLGVNLTVPHKEAVLALLDKVDPLAARVGAVNTIVNREGVLHGYNTDVSGFAAALASASPEGAVARECLVLGAGGAARAVVAALVEGGARVIHVHNRTHARAVALCASAASWGTTECRPLPTALLGQTAASADVIVNATPIGLQGQFKDFPVPVDNFHSGQLIMDLTYGSDPTTLVTVARNRGAAAMDGKQMLVMQAGLAYRLWTGLEAPLEVMRGCIERGER